MSHKIDIDEAQRQIMLLALFKLKRERPGWEMAIGEIEQLLGGQSDWPELSAPYICLNCGAIDHVIGECPKLPPACEICGGNDHTRAVCPRLL